MVGLSVSLSGPSLKLVLSPSALSPASLVLALSFLSLFAAIPSSAPSRDLWMIIRAQDRPENARRVEGPPTRLEGLCEGRANFGWMRNVPNRGTCIMTSLGPEPRVSG